MNMRVPIIAIAASISLIVIAAVLVPIIDDASVDGEHTLDVVIISGQSNAQYNSNYADLTLVNETFGSPSTDCYFYGYDQSNLVRPANNLGELDRLSSLKFAPMYSDGAWRIGCTEPGLAYTLGNKTNNDVYVINVALGGLSIDHFEPGHDAADYATTLIADAMSKIPSTYEKINKVGWMWCQGESDDDTTVDAYIASFNNVQGFYDNLGFKTCYLVQTRSVDSGNAYDAQATIAATNPNVVLASTAPESFTVANGEMLSDDLHYSQKGRDIVSVDVGTAMADHQSTSIRDANYSGLLQAIPLITIVAVVIGVAALAIRMRE